VVACLLSKLIFSPITLNKLNMETLTIPTYEQRLKCTHCPNKDNCPLLKRQARMRAKLCTWHDYTSKEYSNVVSEIFKVYNGMNKPHYEAVMKAKEKKHQEEMKQHDENMREVHKTYEESCRILEATLRNLEQMRKAQEKERQLEEHIKSGKPCISFEQVQFRNKKFREDFDLKVKIYKDLEKYAYAHHYKVNKAGDEEAFKYLKLRQLREFWNENLYTRPN
jgi:hypothetical protein